MFTHSHILARVIEIIAKATKQQVQRNTRLVDLHIDSLSKVEIIHDIEAEFQIDIEDAENIVDSTVFAIATHVIDALAAEGIQSKNDLDTVSQNVIKFEEMVAGLVKPGADIVAEMTPSKSAALGVAINAALRASSQVDSCKRYVIYGKTGDQEAHMSARTDIGHCLTPRLAHKLHMAIGLFGEAGEILESVVKEIQFGIRDEDNEIEESGDIEFYHEGFRQACGFSREEAIRENIEKLGKRYQGHKYTDAQALARADKSPEKVVEALAGNGVEATVVDNGKVRGVLVVQPEAMTQGYGRVNDSPDAHDSPRAFQPQSSADADRRDIHPTKS